MMWEITTNGEHWYAENNDGDQYMFRTKEQAMSFASSNPIRINRPANEFEEIVHMRLYEDYKDSVGYFMVANDIDAIHDARIEKERRMTEEEKKDILRAITGLRMAAANAREWAELNGPRGLYTANIVYELENARRCAQEALAIIATSEGEQ